MSDFNNETINKNNTFWIKLLNYGCWTLITTLAIALSFYVFHFFEDNGTNWVASIISALLGVALTVVITRMLLNKQSSLQTSLAAKQSELDQRRKIQEELNSSKLRAYSKFVLSMNKLANADKVTVDDIKALKNELFGKISFFASDEVLDEIINVLKRPEKQSQSDSTSSKDEDQLVEIYDDGSRGISRHGREVFNEITYILRKDVSGFKSPDSKRLNDLASKFEDIVKGKFDEDVEESELLRSDDINNETNTIKLETTENGFVKFGSTPEENQLAESNKTSYAKTNFWHFIMSDTNTQQKAFEEGVFELGLTERDETWRTDLLKQVKPDDLVFLYQTGANGYIGVFKAKGWRVFEKDPNSNKIEESTFSYSDKEPVIKGDLQKDLERYDRYKAFDIGDTICSSLVVEPLAYFKDGVGCPSKGPYRRTISKYKNELGIILLSRFKQTLNNCREAQIKEGSNKTLPLNVDEFNNVLKKGKF